MFNGKIHYKWQFSIAFCMFTRPGTNPGHFGWSAVEHWWRDPPPCRVTRAQNEVIYIYIITYVYIYIDNSQVKTLFWTKQSKEFDRIRPNICKIQAFKPKRKMLDLSTKHGHGISFVSGCKFYMRNSSSLWLFTRGQFKVVLLKMMSLPKKNVYIPDCSKYQTARQSSGLIATSMEVPKCW